jgi:glycosyltransferase involved in cell wall biosynthesis
MKDQKVTIGLPFFNNEKTLANAIKSVLKQTYKNFELLLIDDGSTDSSLKIAEELCNNDQRVHLIKDGLNKGLVSRLNQIIDTAKGYYIARMDADDIMMPTKLQKQVAVFEGISEVDVVATAAYTIDERNHLVGIRDVLPIEIKSEKDVIKSSLLIHPTIMAKTSWYLRNKYDEAYVRAEDYELWCRTFKHTKFFRITEPLFFYREGNVNIKSYCLSMKTLRKIFDVYGPLYLSSTETKLEIIKTFSKEFTYKVFGFFHVQHLLSAKRNHILSATQQKEALNILKNIIE